MAYVIDTECYPNYWLFAAKDTKTGAIVTSELREGGELAPKDIRRILINRTSIGFNSNHYDLPMIMAALQGFDVRRLKKLSDALILSNTPSWKLCQEFEVDTYDRGKHIDLIEVAPGMTSLKLYGGRLNAPLMQDLPFDPDLLLTDEQIDTLREYCVNDLGATLLLFNKLKPQIELRQAMSNQYGVDLRSKSDAQIAEAVIRKELTEVTGKKYFPAKLPSDYSFHYKIPSCLKFQSPDLNALLKRIGETKFTLSDKGSVQLPEWLKKERIKVRGIEYQMGIGGLHSCEQRQHIVADRTRIIVDMDVVSYYPNLILTLGLNPPGMGDEFLITYQSIVDRRVKAKKMGDKVIADTFKIVCNSSFGKFGSRFSFLYAPSLLLQVTLTGQLYLLMLIERLEEANISIKSANTDGIVAFCPVHRQNTMRNIAWEWMLDTGLELEESHYRSLSSRDVNNYLAVKTDGKTKGKGIFAEPSLAKNPNGSIVYEAVAKHIADGISLEETIGNCDDITKFCTVRRVTGGATWNDAYLGKAIRFYQSKTVPEMEVIRYKRNGNKVPDSEACRPLMNLGDADIGDVNRAHYIQKAKELLAEIGYVEEKTNA